MLSIFPDLLTYGLLAPVLIRLALGLYFLYFGYALISTREISRNKKVAKHFYVPSLALGALSITGGVLVLVGFLTQAGALILALVSAYHIATPFSYGKIKDNRIVSLLLFTMALSLLFSGPGFLAFDLPL